MDEENERVTNESSYVDESNKSEQTEQANSGFSTGPVMEDEGYTQDWKDNQSEISEEDLSKLHQRVLDYGFSSDAESMEERKKEQDTSGFFANNRENLATKYGTLGSNGFSTGPVADNDWMKEYEDKPASAESMKNLKPLGENSVSTLDVSQASETVLGKETKTEESQEIKVDEENKEEQNEKQEEPEIQEEQKEIETNIVQENPYADNEQSQIYIPMEHQIFNTENNFGADVSTESEEQNNIQEESYNDYNTESNIDTANENVEDENTVVNDNTEYNNMVSEPAKVEANNITNENSFNMGNIEQPVEQQIEEPQVVEEKNEVVQNVEQQVNPERKISYKMCIKCGNMNPTGTRICSKCGNIL